MRIFQIVILFFITFQTWNGCFGQTIEQLIQKDELSENVSEKSDRFRKIANLSQKKADYVTSINYAEQAIELSKSIGDRQSESIGYNIIAISYLRMGDYYNCIKYQNKALYIAKMRGAKKDIAASYNNIGSIYTMQGKYIEALPLHLEAIKLSLEIEDMEGIATSHGNAGNVYFYMKDFQQTIYHYRESQKIYKSAGSLIGTMIIEINIGNVYLEEGSYQKALDNYLTGLKMNDEVDNFNIKADNYINIATVYQKLKNYNKALEYSLLAVDSKIKVKDKNGLANAYIVLGSSYINLDDRKNAESNLYEGVRVAQEVGSINYLSELFLNLSILNEKYNDHNKALQYYKKHIVYTDSISNQETKEKISELKVQYETEKKDIQIQLLTKDKLLKEGTLRQIVLESEKREQAFEIIQGEKLLNELQLKLNEEEIAVKDLDIQRKDNELEIAQLENEIKQASLLEEKSKRRNWIIVSVLTLLLGSIAVFFFYQKRKNAYKLSLATWELKTLRNQMKPHFIFNALSSINNFIAKNESATASNYLVSFSKLIRQTLNNAAAEMIPLSEEIDAAKALIDIESINIASDLTYEITVDETLEEEEILVPSLILQPFVENAIWHGIVPKREAGEIKINIYKKEHHLICEIADNGIGREKSAVNSSRHKSQSFGLKITKERLDILSKKHRIESKFEFEDLNPGLKVIISLPYFDDSNKD